MQELIRTNDPIVLDVAETLLTGAGLSCFVADSHMSIMEGSIGMLQRRLLVVDDHVTQARRILVEAGLGHELRDA